MPPGDYVAAILSKQRAETLSSVLYPDDRTYEGKELRLKQQHFFVSATIQVGVPASTGGRLSRVCAWYRHMHNYPRDAPHCTQRDCTPGEACLFTPWLFPLLDHPL